MCLFGGNGGAQAAADQQAQQAAEARADADKKAASLKEGQGNIDNAFSQFDDNYFNGLSQKYLDYANPQLNYQYEQAKKDLTYSLARNGNTDSSVSGDLFGQLAKQYANNQTAISSTSSGFASKARGDVQSAKQAVQDQLNSSFDANAANTSALASAKAIAGTSPTFGPLGTLFTNVAALAAQNKLLSDAFPGGSGGGAKIFGSGPTASGYGIS